MSSFYKLAALVALLCISSSAASARLLRQTTTTATASTDFTSSNGTYLVSTTLVGTGTATATSGDDCLNQCAADTNCQYWSFCPVEQTSGCTVPGVAGATDDYVSAGGCVLSYDSTTSGSAVYSVAGSAVPFIGGSYNPGNVAPANTAGTPPSASNPASFIDPNGTPQECVGFFSGNQWSGDEIECHVCDSDYQLKCDLDTDLIGDDSVKCKFDNAGLGALVNNAYDFDCVVDNTKVPQNQCNWVEFQSKLPACAVEPVSRIMATWKPVE